MNSGSTGHRLFLALFVPEELHAALREQVRTWLPSFREKLRAVPAQNLHLTLAFLGNVPEENGAALVTVVREVCATTAPLRLRIEGSGAFPNARRPRILWVGVNGDRDELVEFARRLHQACEPLAPKMARNPFSPHLTLARADAARANPPIELHRDAPYFGEWTVESVVLAQSHLGHGPPRYEERDRFQLGARR